MIPDLPVYSFTPDWGGLLSLFLTLLLPLFVGLVSTRITSSGMKAVLLLVLASLKTVAESVVAANVADVPWQFVPVVMNVLINFGVACLMYFGFWKPTGVADAALNQGRQTRVIDGRWRD